MRFYRFEVVLPDLHGWSTEEAFDAIREALDESDANDALVSDAEVMVLRSVKEES